MQSLRTQEKIRTERKNNPMFVQVKPKKRTASQMARPMRLEQVVKKAKKTVHSEKFLKTQENMRLAAQDKRIQHELKEMQQTHDLDDIDDDVEDIATLFEWRALEHNHRPKNATWYIVLASATSLISLSLIMLGNIIGAITIALVGAFTYYEAQRPPATMRYRIMADGVALNNIFYHYQDLTSFNIIYEPGETKTVILLPNKLFSPLVHMEIGDADPVAIRDILMEFVPENQELTEPLVDILARRLGF